MVESEYLNHQFGNGIEKCKCSSASSVREEPASFLAEQCGLFHCKDTVGLGVERKDEDGLLAPAAFLPLPSYWDCAGSSQDRHILP